MSDRMMDLTETVSDIVRVGKMGVEHYETDHYAFFTTTGYVGIGVDTKTLTNANKMRRRILDATGVWHKYTSTQDWDDHLGKLMEKTLRREGIE